MLHITNRHGMDHFLSDKFRWPPHLLFLHNEQGDNFFLFLFLFFLSISLFIFRPIFLLKKIGERKCSDLSCLLELRGKGCAYIANIFELKGL